jgi:hypothetical protein
VGASQHALPYASGGAVLHHSTAPHIIQPDSGRYFGRSNYASSKEAEYRIKYGFKFVFLSLPPVEKCNHLGRYGVGVPESASQGAVFMDNELDEYIHSSGTGYKQVLSALMFVIDTGI